jgi:hypothetical protein
MLGRLSPRAPMARPLLLLTACALLLAPACGNKSLTLEGYEKALSAAGVNTGEKEPQMAAAIGAKNGYGFSFPSGGCSDGNLCRCEVYEFDTSIESGREALATVKKNGLMGTRLEFNQNLAIFCQGDSPKAKQAISVLLAM